MPNNKSLSYSLAYISLQGNKNKTITLTSLSRQEAQDWTAWLQYKKITYKLTAKNF